MYEKTSIRGWHQGNVNVREYLIHIKSIHKCFKTSQMLQNESLPKDIGQELLMVNNSVLRVPLP